MVTELIRNNRAIIEKIKKDEIDRIVGFVNLYKVN